MHSASQQSLGERGRAVITRVGRDLGIDAEALLAAYDLLSTSWAARSPTERAKSIHTTDGSPLELSLPLTDRPSELRFTSEPQRSPFDHVANYAAGREVLAEIERLPGVSLAPLEGLLDAFAPPSDDKSFGFAMWLGAVARPGMPIAFKIYLNSNFSRAHGRRWFDVLNGRVSGGTLEAVRQVLGPKGEVGIVSFDLSDDAHARVKLYVGHGMPGPGGGCVDVSLVERLEGLGTNARAGDARALIEQVAPELLGPPNGQSIFVGTTLHLVGDGIDRVTTNVNFLPFGPVPPLPEKTILERFRALMSVGSAATMDRFITSLRQGLSNDVRAVTYTSLQRENGGLRCTLYASPCLYAERGA